LFGSYGLSPQFRGCDVMSPYLTIAFATEALVGTPPAGVSLVGPSFPLRERGDEVALRTLPRERPVVYASFGSQIYYWPQLFEKLLAAGRLAGAHMIFSMGDLAGDARWRGCEVYEYAPQLAILRQASAFVTHGGANSVMEATACGVPMLLSPMCNDQFHQAYFVNRAGIGCVDDLVTATVERIADGLRYLLQEAGVRTRMAQVAQTYGTDGARRAAALIAQLGRA
jgi:UDP:flavonoid glycosyltransferase YjiC (YdhE family)